ncbi:hypothetical protein KPH14_012811 [Odynerus spinipes]|uniref:Vesicular, overexpressed in cancer, prosurvival protein 1 n=1 Tax=Odynerus spinipes TaxID=1348599 RepID=A0AAD9R8Y1_9HYME|nr:hypothetical protein KPH14_012811 [Odynerus spinipes]
MALCILAAALCLILCGNCCRWFGYWQLLKRLCCFTRSPTNGEILPPIIKNFVNCTFDSDIHADHRGSSRDIMVYDARKETVRTSSPSPTETATEQQDFEDTVPPLTSPHLQNRESQRRKLRRSTTPI